MYFNQDEIDALKQAKCFAKTKWYRITKTGEVELWPAAELAAVRSRRGRAHFISNMKKVITERGSYKGGARNNPIPHIDVFQELQKAIGDICRALGLYQEEYTRSLPEKGKKVLAPLFDWFHD